MTVQPIDTGGLSFKIIFHNTGRSYMIDPPDGFDKLPIQLKRKGNYARVIKFGDEKELTFWNHKVLNLGHAFDAFLEHYKIFADETFAELIVYLEGNEILSAELDFVMIKTDKESFFKTKLKVNDLNKIVDDREDTKIDVFGSESLDGIFDESALIEDVMLAPKKIRERAKHEIGDEDREAINTPLVINIGAPNTTVGQTLHMGNPFGLLLLDESDVAESYYIGPDQVYVNTGPGNNVPTTYTTGSMASVHNFYFPVETDISIKVENFRIKAEGQNIRNNNTQIILQAAVIAYDNENHDNVINKEYLNIKTVFAKEALINETVNLTVPKFTRIIFEYRVYIGGRVRTPEETLTLFPGVSITTDTIGNYPASTAKMTRIGFAGKKILSNYSNGQALVNAPRFEEGGEFYWYYITSGYFLRGFTGESFDLSFKQWKEFIMNAFNCDVQINGKNIFIGKHEDFYVDKEVARFEFKPNLDSYEIEINQELVKNKINLKYNKFESDKKDTLDAFHTESEWFIPKRNKGSLDLNLDFTADGYSIEYARREGINAEPTTAKQKDTETYIVDCFIRRIHMPWPFNTYIDILQNRQNQGFEVDDSTLFSKETIYNLRLSLKRLLLDHYGHRLAEIGQKLNNGFPTFSTIFAKNTFFKANGNLRTNAIESSLKTFMGWLREKDDIKKDQLKEPIISPEIYNFTLSQRIKYKDLIKLLNDLISIRGYVTLYSGEKEVKCYPFDLEYDWGEEKLTFKAEIKNEI